MQVRRSLRHPPGQAARADPALAGEADERLVPTALAANSREAVAEDPATEVAAERLLEEAGTARTSIGPALRKEGLEVIANHAVEDGRLGVAGTVAEGQKAAHAPGGSAWDVPGDREQSSTSPFGEPMQGVGPTEAPTYPWAMGSKLSTRIRSDPSANVRRGQDTYSIPALLVRPQAQGKAGGFPSRAPRNVRGRLEATPDMPIGGVR